jgi:hypothetical protein
LYRWWKNLRTYTPPVLVLLGVIGNVLALVALHRKQFQQIKKHNSICFYFSVLCILDALMLFAECGLEWLSFIGEIPHISSLADPVCKVWMFVAKLIASFTRWMTVTCLVDRFLVMWHPMQARDICTTFLAKVVTIMILVGLVSVNIHAMWTMSLQLYYPNPETAQYYCSLDPSLGGFQRVVWPWIEASLNTYLPMLLAVTFTLFLIIGCVYPHGLGDSEQQQMQLTRATIATGLAYIGCQLPTIVMNFVVGFKGGQDYVTETRLILAQALCQVMRCLNNAVFFLLLFACIPLMRPGMRCLIRTQHVKAPAGTTAPPAGANSEQLLPGGATSIEICTSRDVTLV